MGQECPNMIKMSCLTWCSKVKIYSCNQFIGSKNIGNDTLDAYISILTKKFIILAIPRGAWAINDKKGNMAEKSCLA